MPWEAALGAKITVPTLAGDVTLTVPPKAQHGQRLRLKGRGLPGKKPGDQYVLLNIHVPAPQTEAQREAYQRCAMLMTDNPRNALRL